MWDNQRREHGEQILIDQRTQKQKGMMIRTPQYTTILAAHVNYVYLAVYFILFYFCGPIIGKESPHIRKIWHRLIIVFENCFSFSKTKRKKKTRRVRLVYSLFLL